MATYSSNTTMKIGVNVTQANQDGGQFTYTVPSGSYLNLSKIYIISSSVNIQMPGSGGTESISVTTIYEPARFLPSGTILSSSSGGFGTIGAINGFLTTNSP